MNLNEYLKSLGLNDKEIENYYKNAHLRDVEKMKQRVEFYKSYFNMSDKRLTQIVGTLPAFLGYGIDEKSPSSIQAKVKFYADFFGVSLEKSKDILGRFPYLLCYDVSAEGEHSLQSKIEFFQNLMDCDREYVAKMVKNSPSLLTRDIKSLKSRSEFYKDLLNLSDKELTKFIKKFPNVLCYDQEMVLKKVDFYQQTLGLTREKVVKLIKSLPSFLSYDVDGEGQESVKGKIKNYQQIFKISQADAVKMIKVFPAVLCYGIKGDDDKSIERKIDMLDQIAPRDVIVKNPALLSHPALKVKTRYLILSNAFSKDEILTNRKMTTSELKLWARLQYLQEKELSPKQIITSEARFVQSFGVTSQELIKKYPIVDENIAFLEQNHFQRTGERIIISRKERQEILKGQSQDDEEKEVCL